MRDFKRQIICSAFFVLKRPYFVLISAMQKPSPSSYHFITNWQVLAPPEMVYGIISNSGQLTRWWPAVYLDLKVLETGGPNGEGKRIAIYTKGWLPYTLNWQFRVIKTQKPFLIEIEAIGDFIGHGKWTFEANPHGTAICYDWRIEAKKPLLRKLSWLLRPVFSANHLWAMAKGEESLNLEIRRLNGEPNVPAPGGPSFPHNLFNNKVF
jgi:uncharacterized protein YndB with AHSA1/START domain